jgi:hypothetical protein
MCKLAYSEENRIADEIVNDFKHGDSWRVMSQGGRLTFLRSCENSMELYLYNYICPFYKVSMESPLLFNFSYLSSRKISKAFKVYLKALMKEEKERGRAAVLNEFKGLYLRNNDGKLYLYDKKKIK